MSFLKENHLEKHWDHLKGSDWDGRASESCYRCRTGDQMNSMEEK